MFEFLVILAAILVANIVIVVAAFAAMCNPRIMKWYAKKAFKMSKVVGKEMENLFTEEES